MMKALSGEPFVTELTTDWSGSAVSLPPAKQKIQPDDTREAKEDHACHCECTPILVGWRVDYRKQGDCDAEETDENLKSSHDRAGAETPARIALGFRMHRDLHRPTNRR